MKRLFSLFCINLSLFAMDQKEVFNGSSSGDAFASSIDRFFDHFNGPNVAEELENPFELALPTARKKNLTPLLESDSISIKLPHYRGSGSIDFIEGGHYGANGLLMQNALSLNIPKGHVFRFLVGIETVSPLLASAIKQIQTWANQVNGMNLNSTDLATYFLSGDGSKMERAASFLQEQAMVSHGEARDLIEARRRCIEKKGVPLQKLMQNTDFIPTDTSIAGSVFSLLQLDETKKRIFLNLTGTVIVHDEKSISSYPPLHRHVLALLHSGETMASAYEEKNQKIQRSQLILGRSGEKEQILSLVQGIQTKLRENRPLDTSEKKLLSASSFPLGSLISLMTQYQGGGADLVLERYSDLIAFERVIQFLQEGLHEVLSKAKALRVAQSATYALDAYIDQVQSVLQDLVELKQDNDRKLISEQQAIDLMMRLEQTLRGGLK